MVDDDGEMMLLHHQKGVCGHLRIRGHAAALRGRSVSCDYGGATAVMKGKHASFFVAVRKGAFDAGRAPELAIHAASIDGGASESVSSDVRQLLWGEGSVLEVTLEASQLRFWVEYLPYGIEPERGDVVQLEPFVGRSPLSALPPPGVPLAVEDAADGTVSVCWDHAPDVRGEVAAEAAARPPWRCRARLRRSAVFVSRRDTWADTLLHQPVNALLKTETGKRVQPVAQEASAMLRPVVVATKLAWQSIFAVGSTVFAQDSTIQGHGAS